MNKDALVTLALCAKRRGVPRNVVHNLLFRAITDEITDRMARPMPPLSFNRYTIKKWGRGRRRPITIRVYDNDIASPGSLSIYGYNPRNVVFKRKTIYYY